MKSIKRNSNWYYCIYNTDSFWYGRCARFKETSTDGMYREFLFVVTPTITGYNIEKISLSQVHLIQLDEKCSIATMHEQDHIIKRYGFLK